MTLQGTSLSNYPKDPVAYAWLHPVFDRYHENIEVSKGWVYRPIGNRSSPSFRRASRMISDCGLDQIATIEMNRQRILDEIVRLTVILDKLLSRSDKKKSQRVVNDSIRSLVEEKRFDF